MQYDLNSIVVTQADPASAASAMALSKVEAVSLNNRDVRLRFYGSDFSAGEVYNAWINYTGAVDFSADL